MSLLKKAGLGGLISLGALGLYKGCAEPYAKDPAVSGVTKDLVDPVGEAITTYTSKGFEMVGDYGGRAMEFGADTILNNMDYTFLLGVAAGTVLAIGGLAKIVSRKKKDS